MQLTSLQQLNQTISSCRQCGLFYSLRQNDDTLKEEYLVKLPPSIKSRIWQTSISALPGRYNKSYLKRNRVIQNEVNSKVTYLVIVDSPSNNSDKCYVKSKKTWTESHSDLTNFEIKYLLRYAEIADDDYYITSIMKCSLNETRKPHKKEIKTCSTWLKYERLFLKPTLTLLIGRDVAKYYLPKIPISNLYNRLHETEELGTVIALPYKDEVDSLSMELMYKKIPELTKLHLSGGYKSPETNNYYLLTEDEDLIALDKQFESYVDGSQFGFDIETLEEDIKVINAKTNKLAGVSIYLNGTAYYIPVIEHPDLDNCININTLLFYIQKWIMRWTPVIHNAKFEIISLQKYGIIFNFNNLIDTYLLAYLINEPRLGLKDITRNNYYIQLEEFMELLKSQNDDIKSKNLTPLNKIPVTLISDYACADAEFTYRYAQDNLPIIHSRDQDYLYNEILIKVLEWIVESEIIGTRFDTKQLDNLVDIYQLEIAEQLDVIDKYIPSSVNLNSKPELAKHLKTLGIRLTETTDTEQLKLDKDVLQSLEKKHPVIPAILRYNQLNKVDSTYLTGTYKHILNGRVHAEVNQAITKTGRWSYNNPNMQNLPVRTDPIIRTLVIPDDIDSYIVAIDQSQIELRIAAYRSQDPAMLSMLNSGISIHAETTKFIYGIDETNELWPLYYKYAKNGNFARLYGAGVRRLMKVLGCSFELANRFLEGHKHLFAGLERWIKQTQQFTFEHGYTETLFNYRKYLPGIYSSDGAVKAKALRDSINYPIQGTAAYINQLAIINSFNYLKSIIKSNEKVKTLLYKPRLLFQVHDELVYSIPKKLMYSLIPILMDKLTHVVDIGIPTPVEAKCGPNWGDIKLYQQDDFEEEIKLVA